MNMPEFLQYANLLMFPAVAFIIKLNARIITLEVTLKLLVDSLNAHMEREEKLLDKITERRAAERG